MARRAASHPQMEALMSHLHQSNHNHEAGWTNIPRMRHGQRRTRHLSDCHIRNAPTPLTWNLREDLAGLPATRWTHAYHSNLLASCPDSKNVGMSSLQTSPFAITHGGGLLSFKNLMQTNEPHPQCQTHLACQPSNE